MPALTLIQVTFCLLRYSGISSHIDRSRRGAIEQIRIKFGDIVLPLQSPKRPEAIAALADSKSYLERLTRRVVAGIIALRYRFNCRRV